MAGNGLLKEATTLFGVIHDEAPERTDVTLQLISLLMRQSSGRAKGEELARTLIGKAPDDVGAHQLLSVALLRRENFREGWAEYAWRERSAVHARLKRPFLLPAWNGDRPRGKMLVLPDVVQGIGIEILCASMYGELLERGHDLVVESDPRLIPILEKSFPQVEFHPLANPPAPRLQGADLACSATFHQLARHLRGDLADFRRARPYLTPVWRRKAARPRPVIGLSWQSVNAVTGRARSIRPAELAARFAEIDADFVTLQYGDVGADLASMREAGLSIAAPEVDFREDLEGFVEAVAATDLVVTIQNSTAYFAGALGIPCWVLMPDDNLWLWGNEREEGLWFPGIRLLRRSEDDVDWGRLLERTAIDLERWVRHAASDSPPVP